MQVSLFSEMVMRPGKIISFCSHFSLDFAQNMVLMWSCVQSNQKMETCKGQYKTRLYSFVELVMNLGVLNCLPRLDRLKAQDWAKRCHVAVKISVMEMLNSKLANLVLSNGTFAVDIHFEIPGSLHEYRLENARESGRKDDLWRSFPLFVQIFSNKMESR